MKQTNHSVGYLMRLVVMSTEAAINKHARDHGLRIEEIWVLFRVLAKENLTVGELAAETAIERSTLSRVLTRMEAKRLVVKQRLHADQRIVRIRLTDKGRLLARARHPTFRDYEALLVRGIGAEEVRKLKAMLMRMVANAGMIAPDDVEGVSLPLIKGASTNGRNRRTFRPAGPQPP